jgi:L-iditol 2-dehydrogenase
LCPKIRFFATPPIDGTLAQYIEHPEDFCFKMPDHMSFEEGALLEPLSVAVHACQRSGVTAGSHVKSIFASNNKMRYLLLALGQ